jgi:hypothetical protein
MGITGRETALCKGIGEKNICIYFFVYMLGTGSCYYVAQAGLEFEIFLTQPLQD